MIEIFAEVIEEPILIQTGSSQAIRLEVHDCITASMSSKLETRDWRMNTNFV